MNDNRLTLHVLGKTEAFGETSNSFYGYEIIHSCDRDESRFLYTMLTNKWSIVREKNSFRDNVD